MLETLSVVLVRPKYPENVGSAARACLNMGAQSLVLVDPPNWDLDKALPLATVHARHILESATIAPDLPTALAGFEAVFATTVRTGGWRKGIQTPEQCAASVRDLAAEGRRVGLVFGPEDRGLYNEDIYICQQIVTIPTAREGTSLNLAQAVMVLLYECHKAARERPFQAPGPPTERLLTLDEQETLMAAIQQTLLDIDFLKSDNPDYWMLPVRRFFTKIRLRRNEFNLLMGICRQIGWAIRRK